MTARILVIGDAMLDVMTRTDALAGKYPDVPARNSISVGGSGPNVGAWLAYAGASATLIASVGDDPGGDAFERALADCGVRAELTRQPECATGMCVIIIDGSGERHILSDSGANAALTLPMSPIPDIDHVHICAHIVRYPQVAKRIITWLSALRASGVTASLDLGAPQVVADHLEVIGECCAHVDVLFGTTQELAACGTPVAPVIIAKDGARGVEVREGDMHVAQPAPLGPVIDTTGAGDAYAAGFLAIWISGGGIAAAMEFGRKLAAIALERVGAWPPART